MPIGYTFDGGYKIKELIDYNTALIEETNG